MTWNERIRERMSEVGLKNTGLAQLLGVAESTVSHYLSGREMPYELLVKTATVLGLSLDYILVGEAIGDSEEVINKKQRHKIEDAILGVLPDGVYIHNIVAVLSELAARYAKRI